MRWRTFSPGTEEPAAPDVNRPGEDDSPPHGGGSLPAALALAAALVAFVLPATAGLIAGWRFAIAGLPAAASLLLLAGLVWSRANAPAPSRLIVRLASALLVLGIAGLHALPLALPWAPASVATRARAWLPAPDAPIDPRTLGVLALAALAVLGVALLLARHQRVEAGAEEAAAAVRMRAARLASWAAVVALLALAARFFELAATGRALSALAFAVALVLALEIALRIVARAPHPYDAVLVRLFAARPDPLTSLLARASEIFGIDLRGAFALRVAERALVPLALGLAVALWLASAVVMVDTREEALVERFGRLRTASPLQPGLHLKWPWPIERTRRIDVHSIRSFTIGYEGQKAGASMLWTAVHAAEEHRMLLGDGRDLVSVNAILAYRIDDTRAFVYTAQDPERTLRALADRVVLNAIVRRTLDQVLSENTLALADAMESALRDEVARRELGIEIVDLVLVGLHPPIAVAPDYQAVVGAAIEKRALETAALAYREESIPAAHAEAARTLAEAEGYLATRVSTARGEAHAFRAIKEAYERAPDLYVFRRKLEVLERQLGNRHVHVLDDRIERDGGSIWLLD